MIIDMDNGHYDNDVSIHEFNSEFLNSDANEPATEGPSSSHYAKYKDAILYEKGRNNAEKSCQQKKAFYKSDEQTRQLGKESFVPKSSIKSVVENQLSQSMAHKEIEEAERCFADMFTLF